MSDDVTARLRLPFLAGGQMQKHVTLNAALSRLDALTHLAVDSRTLATQPTSPTEGQAWLLPVDPAGDDWGAMAAGAVAAFQDGAWLELAPPAGALVLVADERRLLVRVADDWIDLGAALGRVDFVDRLGVGASPDEANPLIARVNAALLTATPAGEGGTGDLRLELNKEGAADVASVLFQSGYGGRAEIGLVGADAFSLKVSADGLAWMEAFTVNPTSARASFAKGAVRREATVFTAGGTYVVPAWARSVEAVVISGGGGGGGGQGGAAGTLRMGGGGGGAGGHAQTAWPADALVGTVGVTVGAGGAGGAAGASGAAGGLSAVTLDGVTLARAFGGAGGAPTGTAGGGGLAARSGNGGGPSFAASAASGGAASSNPEGAGGGGGGGAVTAANAAQSGGAGGTGGVMALSASGGAAGAGTGGGAGQNALATALGQVGGGGGGGSGSSSGAGFAGGAGGQWGAGGGGGGAGLTGGAGGAGAPGLVVLTAVG